MSDLDVVEKARHIWGNIRPIPPEVLVSLVAEIERLEAENAWLLTELKAFRQDYGAIIGTQNGKIAYLETENARLVVLLRDAAFYCEHDYVLMTRIRRALEGKGE